MQGLKSEFVKLRKEGVEPKDIPGDVIDPVIERIWSLPDEEMLVVSEIFQVDWKPKKGTFEWAECEVCGEVTFSHGLRIANGKRSVFPVHRNEDPGFDKL